jgi:SAM-dependent methyltransferase
VRWPGEPPQRRDRQDVADRVGPVPGAMPRVRPGTFGPPPAHVSSAVPWPSGTPAAPRSGTLATGPESADGGPVKAHGMEGRSMRKSHKEFARLYYDSALTHLQGVVLDVGCGSNPRMKAPSSSVKFCGIDIAGSRISSAKAIQPSPCRSHYGFMRTDASNLPFHHNSFDGVAISFALCAVSDIDQVCAEILRVAKPGAQVVVVEHIRSQLMVIAAMQRVQSMLRKARGLCCADRDPISNLSSAGFIITQSVKSPHLAPLHFILATVPREK